MTFSEALAIPPATDAFDDAVEYFSDLCEREPRNREAAQGLIMLLERNDAHLMACLYGFKA